MKTGWFLALAASAALAFLAGCAERVVKVSSFGFDPEDSTRFIQAALDSGARTVVLDRQKGPWVSRPLFGRSNQEIVFEDGVELVAKRGEFKGLRDSLIFYHQTTNATVRGLGAKGGVLRMWKCDYQKPPYEPAEWRYALQLRGVNGMTVENMTFRSSGGDGIVVARGSRDVVIRKCVCDDNHRQGISVGDCENLLIEDCVLSNTSGTPPQDGIDFEPDVCTERLVNVTLRNVLSINNAGYGFELMLDKLNVDSRPVSIRLENCRSVGSGRSVNIGGSTKRTAESVKGLVEFRGCSFENATERAVRIANVTAPMFDVGFYDCVISNASPGSAASEIEIVLDNYGQGMADGFVFENLRIFQPQPRPWIMPPPIGVGPLPQRFRGDVTVTAPGVPDRTERLDRAWLAKRMPLIDGGRRLPSRVGLPDAGAVSVVDGRPGAFVALAPCTLIRGADFVFFAEAPGKVRFAGQQVSAVKGRKPSAAPMTVTSCADPSKAWKVPQPGEASAEFSVDVPARGFYRLRVPAGSMRFALEKSTVPVAIDVTAQERIVAALGGAAFSLWFDPGTAADWTALLGGSGYYHFGAAVCDPGGQVVQSHADVDRFIAQRKPSGPAAGLWRLDIRRGSKPVYDWVTVDLLGAPGVIFLSNEKYWK